ncbi:MAG: DUF4114 domain-containing protein [Sandaracinus sp.]
MTVVGRGLSLLVLLASALGASPAAAQCTQPSGTRIPTDPGCDSGHPTGLLPTFACACDTPGVCNIGATCASGLPGPDCPDLGMNATCESRMWHAPNDNSCIPSRHAGLDPVLDCHTMPETFSPTCALTFRVLTRGTARFQNAFGWYEVTGSAPTADDLHVMLDCSSAPGSSVVLDLRSDPAYHGGEVGFFLLTPEDHAAHGTCAGGDCCASVARYAAGVGYAYYSQHALNPDGTSFVHLLVYDSTVWDRKFYFAWEDTFAAPNNDFTDLVTSVDGVECAGAGAECDTGMPGACGRGVTRCDGGTLACTPVTTAADEVCNGVDDDCDGTLDESVTCPGTDVCDDGRCVHHCQPSDEFSCAAGFGCDVATGLCRETACDGVPCAADQVCRGGTCVAECEGVVCPHGQICARDQCIDPCAGVTCGARQVCRGGLCVPGCDLCDGIVCAGGLMCTSAGTECVDPSCPSTCPSGTFCRAGSCVDACDGVVCPRHGTCVAGECVVPTMPGRDAGISGADAGGSGGDAGPASDAGPAFDSGHIDVPVPTRRGCGCEVPGRARGGAGLAWLVGLALLAARRRR